MSIAASLDSRRWLRLATLVVALFCSFLAMTDARAQPRHPVVSHLSTVEMEGLRFHFDEKERDLVGPVLALAPALKARILSDLSPDALSSVDIYFLGDIATYFEAQKARPRNPHWASGLALPGEDVILIRLEPGRGTRLELDRTLAHELSHIGLYNFTGGRSLPHWLVEGFALLQTEAWTLTRAGPLAEAAVAGTVIPLWELDESFPAQAQSAQLAYAESGHFVRWVIKRYGRDRFRKLLGELATGAPFKDAFIAAYGQSFDTTEQIWREELIVADGWIAVVVASSTLFFAISVFFLGLYVRVRHERRAAFARLDTGRRDPVPEHLRNFGPFAPRP